MTHVHYKFSSKLSSDTVVFDDTRVTLMELKRQIMRREKLRAGDCDLQITNAQTGEEYTDDEGVIPKGSSVIIRRIPIIGVKSGSNTKTRKIERSGHQLHHAFGAIKAMANLAEADVPEEEKINTVIAQASISCPKNFIPALPANYTCYRCGDTGHHIRNCPTSGHDRGLEAPLRLKKSTGIPRSFMVEVDDPSVKGAMLTNCGHYAIPAMHAKAYAIGKKEKPPFLLQKPESEDKEDPVPKELLCLICHDLLSDAVVIPCCGTNYCDDCIRTTLLDSEEHVCPTCKKSHVSPDTLTANKFLRQAVNTFEKEQGQAKSLQGRGGTSQSPNPTLMPFTMQNYPQKAYQSTHNLQAANTAPSSQVCGAPPTATGPAPASNNLSTSLQTVPACPEMSHKEAEEKTYDDSPPAALSALLSNKDPAAAVSQLTPLVNSAAVDQTDSVNPKQSTTDFTGTIVPESTGQVPGHTSPCWESSFSSSGWSKSKSQQFPPFPSASPYPAAPPPPLFLPPPFHMGLAAQQPLNRFAPGYQPATPVWAPQTPQGAPIPSLCSSTSVSSTPTHLTKEWCVYQGKKSERSPHRRHAHGRSSSRSNSKSSKSRSSHSHSRSSSRSRSRSCSKGRSGHSHHRDLLTHSHSSHSYSYGYRRSPTPSSPLMGYHSRSASSSDHRKNSRRSRRDGTKSTRHSSRRRGDTSKRETGSSRTSSASNLDAQHANKTGSPGMDRQRYLQWKREYKEWCEKYYNSYVDHFHQLPPSSTFPQWLGRDGSRNHSLTNSESRNHPQGNGDDGSPSSQSSSDSCSSPSHPSSERLSTPSQSSRDRRPSPSHLSHDSRSPPSQSSSDGCSALSGDKDRLRAYQQRCAEKHSRLPVMLPRNSGEANLRESRKDDEQLIAKKLENPRTLRYDQKSLKKHEEEIEERASSPDAADSTDDYRKDKRKHSAGTNICKDGNPVQDIASASEVVMQPIMNPDKRLDEDEKSLEIEKGWRTGKYSGSRLDGGRRHNDKPSKGAGRGDTGRYRNSRGRRGSDSESENRKRKGEDMERSSVEAQKVKYTKTEVPGAHKRESLNPFEKAKTEKKKERKTWPLTAKDIWEGEIKVKPTKKINININIDGKRKEERTEKPDLSIESVTEETTEEMKKSSNGEEEKLNRGGFEVNDMKESSKNQEGESKETIKPDERETPVWKKATFRDSVEQTRKKIAEEKKEDREEGMRACKEEDVETAERSSIKGGQEEGRRVISDSGSQEMGELAAGSQKEKAGGEDECQENRGVSPGESKAKVAPMEEVKRRMREEEEVRSKIQRSRKESVHHGRNTAVEEESSHEGRQEGETVVKTVKFSQDRATGIKDELVLIQVPRSKWEEEESEEEEEQDEGEVKVQMDAPAACLPSSFVSVTTETPTDRETENKQQGNRQMDSSCRNVAPSSGEDRPDRISSTDRDREREKRMEMDRQTDKEKGKESERPREGQREGRSTKEKRREEEKGRSRKREGNSMRNFSSSSHPNFYLTSRDTERRDRQRGDDQGGNKSSCCPGGESLCCRGCESSTMREWPDQNAHQTYRDMFLDLNMRDKDHSHRCHSPQDPSGNFRLQHRRTGTHHTSPSLSQSRVKGNDLPSGFSRGPQLSEPIMSSLGRESMQGGSENVSKVEKEWKRKRADEPMKGGERDEEDEQDGQAERQGGRELEEGERSSSSAMSSSASQEGSGEDGRIERKKRQKRHKREKGRAAPELPEGEELKRLQPKKSKNNRNRGEDQSSGEIGYWWKEEKDHT